MNFIQNKSKNNKISDSEREKIDENMKIENNEIESKNNNNNSSLNRNQKSQIKTKRIQIKGKINNDNNNNKNIIKFKTIDEINESKNNKDYLKFFLKGEDLQDMDYEEAIIYDKRSFLRIYWGFLVDTQIILGTFFTENFLDLFVIKFSFFIFTFQISFFLNAFFYTDEYISDAYYNNGVLDFFSGLPKSVYSFVATLITTNLLRMLSNSKRELKKIIKEEKNSDNYITLINDKLKKLRNKLIIYFILLFSLCLFFVYYVSCFCSVYKYSQKYWFFGCLESFGMDSAVAIGICFFLTLFRYISIRKKIKCLYCLADFISTFL